MARRPELQVVDEEGIPMATNDLCDYAECNARALVRIEFVAGPLYFCGHHWRAVEPVARAQALDVVDERELAAV